MPARAGQTHAYGELTMLRSFRFRIATAVRCALVVFLLAVTGCGGKGVVPVEVHLSLDGKPLADASVSLIRTGGEQGRGAFGITNEAGVASVTTFEPLDGALPGNYAVVVLKAPESMHTYAEEEVDSQDFNALMRLSAPHGTVRRSRRKRVRTIINEVYAAPHTTPLSCEVSSTSHEFQFELNSQ